MLQTSASLLKGGQTLLAVLTFPFKTRRASQKGAGKRAVLFERQRVSQLAARFEKRKAARRAASYGRLMLVGHSRRRRLIGSVFFHAKENERNITKNLYVIKNL
jgi:hypothetical protein